MPHIRMGKTRLLGQEPSDFQQVPCYQEDNVRNLRRSGSSEHTFHNSEHESVCKLHCIP